MVKHLYNKLRKETIVNILLLIIIMSLLILSSPHFKVIINYHSWTFNINYLCIFILLLFIKIEYTRYYNYKINNFYYFTFYLISLIYILLLSINFSYIYFLEQLYDYLYKNTLFSIQIYYSLEYKTNYINNIIETYLHMRLKYLGISFEQLEFMKKILQNAIDYTWIEIPGRTLKEIHHDVVSVTLIAEYLYPKKGSIVESSAEIVMELIDPSTLAQSLFTLAKRIIIMGFSLYTVPKAIVLFCGPSILIGFVQYKFLLPTYPLAVQFQMTPIEFYDISYMVACEIIWDWHPLQILYELLTYKTKLTWDFIYIPCAEFISNTVIEPLATYLVYLILGVFPTF